MNYLLGNIVATLIFLFFINKHMIEEKPFTNLINFKTYKCELVKEKDEK